MDYFEMISSICMEGTNGTDLPFHIPPDKITAVNTLAQKIADDMKQWIQNKHPALLDCFEIREPWWSENECNSCSNTELHVWAVHVLDESLINALSAGVDPKFRPRYNIDDDKCTMPQRENVLFAAYVYWHKEFDGMKIAEKYNSMAEAIDIKYRVRCIAHGTILSVIVKE